MRLLAKLRSIALAAIVATPATAFAAYPERPVTMVVVFPAGGATDLIGRLIQPALAKALGVDVVVKNAGGGGGTIGTAEVAAAKPDGYTIGLAPIGPTTTQPHLRELPYDTPKDLIPVCRVYDSPVVMMAAKDGKYADLKAMVEAAKSAPRSVTYASVAPGSIPHVVMAALEQAAGIEMKHVPFPGSAAMVKALLGGTVDALADVANLAPKYDLRPLAVYAEERMPEFPDTPTMREFGYDLIYSIWGGLFAPAGTPDEAVQTLSAACGEAMTDAKVIEGMKKQQTPIAYLDTAAFTSFVKSEYEKNGKVLAAAGLAKKK